jgi:hypothetical protein
MSLRNFATLNNFNYEDTDSETNSDNYEDYNNFICNYYETLRNNNNDNHLQYLQNCVDSQIYKKKTIIKNNENDENYDKKSIDSLMSDLQNAIIEKNRKKYVLIAEHAKNTLHNMINDDFEGSENDYLKFCNKLKTFHDMIDYDYKKMDRTHNWQN